MAVLLAVLAAAALACDPHLPVSARGAHPGSGGGSSGSGGAGGGQLVVVAEPPAPLDAVPRVLRLRAALPGLVLDPTRLLLVHGSIVPRQLHELHAGKVSAALGKRLVHALAWSEAISEVLAPAAPLQAGEVYTLVMADVPAALEVHVAPADAVPLLGRIWPPEGASSTAAFAVWCGDGVVPPVETSASPAPGGPAGKILRGAVAAGAGERCVRFEADPAGTDASGIWVPPPVVASAADPPVPLRLDPRPLQVDGPLLPMAPPSCSADEVSFGPGCARVADDRLYGRSPSVPLLWAVAGAGTDSVLAAGPGDPFAITGLPPATDVVLDVATVDARGAVLRTVFAATTLPPMPHVVLNEVLAHPLGPKPAQEWVEIVNDGPVPAELEGYVLFVGSGATPLPAATLPPGAFALIVDDTFVAADGLDPDPASGTLLLHVPHLGKHGLSSSGVALSLVDADGNVVSSFPAKPKPKQGSSVARRVVSAPDALAGSFAPAAPSPGRTNTW